MKPNRSNLKKAFSLVEVTLALGLATFVLIIVFGLLSVGLGTNQDSLSQSTAINLATAICADLRQTPSAAAVAASGGALTAISPTYKIDVTKSASSPIYLDESGALLPSAAGARYKATITLTQPTAGQRTATYGNITLSWPPTAVVPVGSVSTFIALDRN